MSTVLVRDKEAREGFESDSSSDLVPALGAPLERRRPWFRRGKASDPDAIATQVGVP